jgi:SAM-dependent methyltransferase
MTSATLSEPSAFETRMVALFEATLDELGAREGYRILDVGRGMRLFLQLARQRGATAAGIDGAAPLPFPDGSFDAVTGFDALQGAPNPVGVLREAGRVGRRVVLATWGRPDQCEAAAYLRAVAALVATPEPFALSDPGALAAFAARGGLDAGARREVPCVWTFPDEATLLRGLLATRSALAALAAAGERALTRVVLDAVAPFRTSDGGFRLENVFHYITAHP